MLFDGSNLEEVLEAHDKWVRAGGEIEEGRADFTGANLKYVNFPFVNLYGAILRGANFRYANLYGADMRMADLTGANMFCANLYLAKLNGAIGIPFIPMNIPDTGSFIAWKRIRLDSERRAHKDSAIVKLLIPEDAERIQVYNGEFRASKAKVLEIQTLDGQPIENAVGVSIYPTRVPYVPGETIVAEGYSNDRYQNMVPGIYFYLNREQAVEYMTFGRDSEGNIIEPDPKAIEKALEESNHW